VQSTLLVRPSGGVENFIEMQMSDTARTALGQ